MDIVDRLSNGTATADRTEAAELIKKLRAQLADKPVVAPPAPQPAEESKLAKLEHDILNVLHVDQ